MYHFELQCEIELLRVHVLETLALDKFSAQVIQDLGKLHSQPAYAYLRFHRDGQLIPSRVAQEPCTLVTGRNRANVIRDTCLAVRVIVQRQVFCQYDKLLEPSAESPFSADLTQAIPGSLRVLKRQVQGPELRVQDRTAVIQVIVYALKIQRIPML